MAIPHGPFSALAILLAAISVSLMPLVHDVVSGPGHVEGDPFRFASKDKDVESFEGDEGRRRRRTTSEDLVSEEVGESSLPMPSMPSDLCVRTSTQRTRNL